MACPQEPPKEEMVGSGELNTEAGRGGGGWAGGWEGRDTDGDIRTHGEAAGPGAVRFGSARRAVE